MNEPLIRCDWSKSNDLMVQYHDTEWGVPVHNDRLLFEHLVLDGAQAGLSWNTVLQKRAAYRQAYDNFDAEEVARYDDAKIAELLANAGIIRNRQKILSSIQNARAFLKIQEQYGSFDAFIWQFTEGQTLVNAWAEMKDIPATSPQSDAMSKALKRHGFSFVGSTICYAFMQASGMVNDHLVTCFRYHACMRAQAGH